MTFSTLTFVIFLWLVFAAYWALRMQSHRNALVVAASYFFYGWWDFRFCGLMLAACTLDYLVGLGLDAARATAVRRALLCLSCLYNLGTLCVFKYYNFFVSNLAGLLTSLGWNFEPLLLQVILPVGISFYTFQTLGYVFDVYRRQVPACRRLFDYLAFVSFFPQLVAGPIERAANTLPQFLREREFTYSQGVDGCRQILWGFFKKIVVADNLALIVNECYAEPAAFDGPRLAYATVCFAMQIYCDFSAYSDIAVGTAKLFGIELMRNFAYPYFSRSPAEFWRRWHISLSTWFRDNVFIPLGGSRVGRLRLAWNLMATFVISGVWHGAAWTFVVWGALNGLGVLAVSLTQSNSKSNRQLHRRLEPVSQVFFPAWTDVLQILATFAFICVTWVFFRATSLEDAWLILTKTTVGLFETAESRAILGQRAAITAAVVMVLLLVEWAQRHQPHPLVLDHWPRPIRWLTYSATLWTILLLRPSVQTGQFIYFQF